MIDRFICTVILFGHLAVAPVLAEGTRTPGADPLQGLPRIVAQEELLAGLDEPISVRCQAVEDRFVKISEEEVLDCQGGVIWASRDNGRDINWTDATMYCASLGAGWRLPSYVNLLMLYDESGAFAQRMGSTGSGAEMREIWIRPATDRIRLTGIYFWSAETRDSSEAGSVDLHRDKNWYFMPKSWTGLHRALCIRSQ